MSWLGFAQNPLRELPLFQLAARIACLLGPIALVQLGLHPVLSGGSFRNWALYWLYTAACVVLPGTLVAVRAVAWRSDWMTWVGLGWALGHGFELVGFLLAKQVGVPLLFVLWVPLAYAITWAGQQEWRSRILPVEQPRRVAAAFVVLLGVGSGTYFLINLPEISTSPPYISDLWFHVANAHEFRDHSPMQDPRLAGEPFNYHVFGYAASAAASLATNSPIAPILIRYSGTSCVLLVALGLFNLGRAFGRKSVLAGVFAALLVLFPLEIWTLVGPWLDFQTTFQLYGIYLSTSTLAGHVFLPPLLLLALWLFRGMPWRCGWPLVVLGFAGAGSKAMFGPIFLCGAAGVVGGQLVFRRTLDRRAIGLLGLLSLGILPAFLPLIAGDDSYAQTLRFVFADFASYTTAFRYLTAYLGVPSGIARGLWLLGFCTLVLLGAALATYARRNEETDSRFIAFIWLTWIAALFPALGTALSGASQLFFLYYANAALAAIAGYGLVRLVRWRHRWRAAGAVAALWLATQLTLGFQGSLLVADEESNLIWRRASWWPDAVTERGRYVKRAPLRRGARNVYFTKLSLTDDVRDALDWARRNLPQDAVFMVNAYDASVYGAMTETRAYLETTRFHVVAHETGRPNANLPYFAYRHAVLGEWKSGREDAVEHMRRAGITHLFHDRENGFRIRAVPGLGPPIFENPSFAIYALDPPESE